MTGSDWTSGCGAPASCASAPTAPASPPRDPSRINRLPTEKPHARLRVGDVLTVPVPGAVHGGVRVVRVAALAARRGRAAEARALYDEIADADP